MKICWVLSFSILIALAVPWFIWDDSTTIGEPLVFAQPSIPVIVSLYWPKTNPLALFAGILATQAFYMLSVFTPFLPDQYAGWDASLVGMLLGLVIVVSGSLLPGIGSRRSEASRYHRDSYSPTETQANRRE